jgi:hypothetical protein
VLFVLLIFVLAGPVIMFVLLRKHQGLILLHDIDKLDDHEAKGVADFAAKWGGLFEPYCHRAYYWQAVVLLRRVVLVAIRAAFFQEPVLMFLVFSYANCAVLFAHVWAAPYQRQGNNKVESVALFLLLLLSMFLTGFPPASTIEGDRQIFARVMVGWLCDFCLCLLFAFG